MTLGNWRGSLPELVVFKELLRRGYEAGLDFHFQSSIFGGRTQRGGFVIDFLFENPPSLIINVQGEYYHYERGTSRMAVDKLFRAMMAGRGYTVIFIDESDVMKNVRYYVGEALAFRDHSRLSR